MIHYARGLTSFVFLGLSVTAPSAAAQQRSAIHADETVIVLPTAARLDAAGDGWIVPLHAWIFEREEDSLLRGVFLERLAGFAGKLDLPQGVENNRHFQDRGRDFLVDDEGGKVLELRFAGRHTVKLPATGGNGHAETDARLPIADLPSSDGDPWLDAAVIMAAGEGGPFSGSVQLIAPEGPSVISDIDDTNKISHVTDHRLLIESTFLKAFEAVPGMAGAYRSWQDGGAVFQYLSSSPWQLYPALAKFIESADFPRGSFHLRYLRVADLTILDLLDPPQKTKPPVIKDLLEAYPGRQFFLVGDTGECDPEIYGAIARTHSGRIGHIYIRDVAARKVPDCAGSSRPTSGWNARSRACQQIS